MPKQIPFFLSPQMQEALEGERIQSSKSNDITARGFPWSKKSKEAAALFAEGMTWRKIAEKVHTTTMQLSRWQKHPAFRKRIAEIQKQIENELARTSIANKVQRIKAINSRHERLQRVIEARAEQYKDIPGGDSGMLARDIKIVGRGQDQETIELFNVDTGLLKSMLDLEKHAAIEVGQWNETTSPLSADQEQVNGFHLTIEDRRTFILAVCSELGVPINPADFEGTALALGHSLPAPRTPDDQGRQNA